MARISSSAIRQMIKKKFKVKLTETGAEKIAEILEKEAKRISVFAVENAKRNKRGKVIKKDIKDYVIRRAIDGR